MALKAATLWVFAFTSIVQSNPSDRRPEFVQDPPPRLLWPTTRGAHAVCRAIGFPTPDVQWVTSEGQTLTSIPSLRHIQPDGELVLGARGSLSDVGTSVLRCKASNRAGVTLSSPMVLQTGLTTQPAGALAAPLNCNIRGCRSAVTPTTTPRSCVAPSNTCDLYGISAVAVEDSVMSHNIRQLTSAKVGSSVVLRCELSMVIGYAHIQWLQDGHYIPFGHVSPDLHWFPGADGILFGADLTQADLQSEYSCRALDVTSQSVKLTSEDMGVIESVSLHTIEARVSETAVLPCFAKHPGGGLISWQHQETNGAWVPVTEDGIVRSGVLIIPNVNPYHAGRYACSSSGETTPRVMLKLIVWEPLTSVVSPDPLLVGTGSTGSFNCSIRGGRGSPVTFSWQHEGRPLHNSLPVLSVGPVRSHHAGQYQCTVTDHTDSFVASATLKLADRPPRLTSTFSEAITRIGQSLTFRCEATGVPPPRIHWTLDDRPLPASPEKYSINTRAAPSINGEENVIVSILSINIRSADEGGRYGCNATNSKGSQSHYARLNVFGPPNIRYLSTIHVKAEGEVLLYCPYSGYPINHFLNATANTNIGTVNGTSSYPYVFSMFIDIKTTQGEVSWKRDDGTVLDVIQETDDQLGLLRLNPSRNNVAGSYTCEVRAESGEIAKRAVRVEVHKTPKTAPINFPEELEVSGSTQSTCSLISGDKPIQFTWLKDNLPIPSLLKVEQKNMDFFSILIIQELTSLHNGEYTCKASNDFGTVSQSTTLVVKEPPTWVWRAQNTSVSAGSVLLLPCSAKGQPAPRISWEFSIDGENWRHLMWRTSDIDVSTTDSGSILNDGTIWLKAVQPEHEGWYRCSARAQHAFLHHIFYLDVREPPRLSRSGGAFRWAIRGSSARLTCEARGESELQIHWTHDSRPLALHGAGAIDTRDTGSGTLISELTIPHAAPENAGEYRCHARNLYGSDELTFKLFVKERPTTPEEVRVSDVWSRKARVTWRVARGAIVSHYTLQYRSLKRDLIPIDIATPIHLDTWTVDDVVNMTITNTDVEHLSTEGLNRGAVTISDLSPDTRYAMRLAAFNDVGASVYTSPLHFTTREEAPGSAPKDIVLRALKPYELQITWQPPPRDSWHGTLLGYTIKWWQVSEDGKDLLSDKSVTESGTSAESTSSVLKGLRAATRYGVTVRAYNAAGVGPASPPHYRHTIESPPTGSVEGLSCAPSGSTSVRLSWRPPIQELRGGLITHYTVQYSRKDSDPLLLSQDAYLRVQGEETTVSRLSPYAEYEIRVRAHNSAGDGPLSTPQLCRTEEDVPSAPGGMKLIALSERSLRASWLPPPDPNGRITFYTLYVKDLSGSQDPNETRINSCTDDDGNLIECMKTIRGLRPGRTYEAWVRASTSAGEGPPSSKVACQTSGLAPARISSFGGIAIGASGSILSLRCVIGGNPPPTKKWLRDGNVLHQRPPFQQEGDALQIKNLDLSHSDNYTCVAENPHGSDSVTWKVVVLKPPIPPSIVLIEARSRELELELRPAPKAVGHSRPVNYNIHWRLAEPEGEWRVQPASVGPIVLRNLRCGSTYRVFATCASPPGPPLSVRTMGSPPLPPSSPWFSSNSSSVRLDVSQWGEGGCGAISFSLEWAGPHHKGHRDLAKGGDHVIGGLTPGTRYRLAVRATNEAGSVREIYEFTTTSDIGFAEEVDAPFPATAGELALLLALCAMLSLAALTILAILLRKKRSDGRPVNRIPSNEKAGCGTYRAPLHPTSKIPPDDSDVYEISPYATFAGPPPGPTGSRAYTLQLRALARHDDDAAPPQTSCCDEETCIDSCDAQRRRRRRRHYCAEHGCSQDSGS